MRARARVCVYVLGGKRERERERIVRARVCCVCARFCVNSARDSRDPIPRRCFSVACSSCHDTTLLVSFLFYLFLRSNGTLFRRTSTCVRPPSLRLFLFLFSSLETHSLSFSKTRHGAAFALTELERTECQKGGKEKKRFNEDTRERERDRHTRRREAGLYRRHRPPQAKCSTALTDCFSHRSPRR